MRKQGILRAVLSCMLLSLVGMVACKGHGSNRTGIIVAAYRIVYQGWSVEQAEKELRDATYGFREYWYKDLVTLLRNTDWAAVKKRLNDTKP